MSALLCRIVITLQHKELPSCKFYPMVLFPAFSWFFAPDLVLERFIKSVTEVSVELEPFSLLFIQQEAVDVGEQLV